MGQIEFFSVSPGVFANDLSSYSMGSPFPQAGTLTDNDDGTVFEDGEELFFQGTFSTIGKFQGVFRDLLAEGQPNVAILVEGSSNSVNTFFSLYWLIDDQERIAQINPKTIEDLSNALWTGADLDVPCFLAGTLIATPSGPVPVETLRPGHPVLTADGRSVPVVWLGHRRVARLFAHDHRNRIVRVAAGALGGGLPLRDLHVTADHALFLDGLLICAGALVNGAGIDWAPLDGLGATCTVYHVETEGHEVLLAEGAPAESFIDYAGRGGFANPGQCPDPGRIIAEMPCPRVSAARHVPPLLRRRLRANVVPEPSPRRHATLQ